MRILVAMAIVCAAAAAQTTSKENQVRDRGQTPTMDGREIRNSGHTPIKTAERREVSNLAGILVDAGCKDRELTAAPPEAEKPGKGKPAKPGPGAQGVHVDPNVMRAERGDVMRHQVPDLATRQMDPSCSITGGTKAFALLLPNGRLLNLDEGGNTKAIEAFQATAAGREVLDGHRSGAKPKAKIHGSVRGDRIVVKSIRL